MKKLREYVGFSFKELEQSLWSAMLKEFGNVLVRVLEAVDEELRDRRDKQRYASRDFVKCSMGTLFGQGIAFKRRRYVDTETGENVYLLDAVLGLRPHQQTSPALEAAILTQSVTTSSYRKAAESLSQLLGFQAVSHETVRQVVLRAGAALEQMASKGLEDPQGSRKVDVLVLETDGMMVSLQQEGERSIEEKIVTSHEGWEPRYSSSKEFALRHVRQFRTQQTTDFWDDASRWVYSHYDIDDQTVVVINGDRASWIRKGVEYFPNAMYQVDRFHLLRELKRLFGGMRTTHHALQNALDGSDVTGATFIAELTKAVQKLTDEKKHEEASRLLQDLATMPEATVDYRRRLQARKMCIDGLRGLGAAESQVDRLSDRIKGRGRSWRPTGLAAMMELQCARNTGLFGKIVERVDEWCKDQRDTVVSVKEVTGRAVRNAMARLSTTLGAGVPVKSTGTTASGGLSNLFHRLNEGGMPA